MPGVHDFNDLFVAKDLCVSQRRNAIVFRFNLRWIPFVVILLATAFQLIRDALRHLPAAAILGMSEVPGDALVQRRALRHGVRLVPFAVDPAHSLTPPGVHHEDND